MTREERQEKALSNKIVRLHTTELVYPDDGRRRCDMSTDSELFCKRTKENKYHYGRDVIELGDVKQFIKGFNLWLQTAMIDDIFKKTIQNKIKELAGDKLTD